MPKTLITLLLLFVLQDIHSQKLTKEDSIALTIPQNLTSTTAGISSFVKEHFLTDTARLRAIFVCHFSQSATAFSHRCMLRRFAYNDNKWVG